MCHFQDIIEVVQAQDLGGYQQAPQMRTCLQITLEEDLVCKGQQAAQLIVKVLQVEVNSKDRH
jgi:hypothetical protein